MAARARRTTASAFLGHIMPTKTSRNFAIAQETIALRSNLIGNGIGTWLINININI